MRPSLFLDTARYGQMSPLAQAAVGDYLRCQSEAGISPHLDDLLHHGWNAWPRELQARFPHLSVWPGLSDLRKKLQHVVDARPQSQVLFANRSCQLMQFAARLFFGPCRNVLITDCTWPNYETILRRQLGHAGRSVCKVAVREQLLRGQMSKDELVGQLMNEFVRRHCDGIFLPAVDNFGIAFPVQEIVDRISQMAMLRFVVVDGVQAFGHVPANLSQDYCDFYFTGCHKWLGSGIPMGIGFYGKRRSAGYIETRLSQSLQLNFVDDPLLVFSEGLVRGVPYPFGETVNLLPLIACSGALSDLVVRDGGRDEKAEKSGGAALAASAAEQGWRPLLPDEALRSSIVMLERPCSAQSEDAVELRRGFADRGVYLSSYSDGRIRLALPPRILSTSELEVFDQAMRALSRRSPSVGVGCRDGSPFVERGHSGIPS